VRLLALALAAGALYAIAHARGWWQGVSDAMPDLEDEMAGVQIDIRDVTALTPAEADAVRRGMDDWVTGRTTSWEDIKARHPEWRN
jgi:hypothetical protein